jgi:DNA-binding NtrC family response regulator
MSHKRKPLRVLHIENEDHESRLVSTELRKVSTQLLIRRVCEESEFHRALKQAPWDFIFFNYHAGMDAIDSLRYVKNHYGDLPFILISGPVGEDRIAALMREGVEDFILKGNYQTIEAVVKSIVADRSMRKKAQKSQLRAFEAFATCERVAHSKTNAREIFIVDDDEDLCEVMSWAMKREGYQVRTFTSGKDALSALTDSHPALLIVDFHLGDMNGCEFLNERKKQNRDCPVILISGSPDEVKSAARVGEYVSIVEKPLDLEGLLREIKLLSVPCSPKSSIEASTPPSHGPASAG